MGLVFYFIHILFIWTDGCIRSTDGIERYWRWKWRRKSFEEQRRIVVTWLGSVPTMRNNRSRQMEQAWLTRLSSRNICDLGCHEMIQTYENEIRFGYWKGRRRQDGIVNNFYFLSDVIEKYIFYWFF